MGDIEVTAEEHGLGSAGAAGDGESAGFEPFAVLEEGGVPVVVTQRDAREVVFGVGGVNGDDVEVGEFASKNAAFGVGVAVFVAGHGIFGLDGFREAIGSSKGLGLGEHGGAGVAGTFGRVPELVVAGQVDVGVIGAGLGFLEAENVGLFGLDEGHKKIFAGDGANTVDVPGVEFHGGIIAQNGTGTGWNAEARPARWRGGLIAGVAGATGDSGAVDDDRAVVPADLIVKAVVERVVDGAVVQVPERGLDEAGRVVQIGDELDVGEAVVATGSGVGEDLIGELLDELLEPVGLPVANAAVLNEVAVRVAGQSGNELLGLVEGDAEFAGEVIRRVLPERVLVDQIEHLVGESGPLGGVGGGATEYQGDDAGDDDDCSNDHQGKAEGHNVSRYVGRADRYS